MAGKNDIVDAVAETTGLTKKQAGETLDAILGAIRGHLESGYRVQLPGFGSFSISERAARTGRNPKTGATIKIAASKNVKFKAGKDLKEAVN